MQESASFALHTAMTKCENKSRHAVKHGGFASVD